MRAVWYERNGDAAVLQYGEMPDPEPAAGEVRIRVATSGVNPSDWKRRQGATARIAHPRVIPNQDGAGIIDQVGAGVPETRLGEPVWLYQSQFGRPFGTAAEYTVQPADRAVPLPENADFTLGAGLGVPALTAHRCLFADGPVAGKTVLVPGGAGAVGNMALQMARLAGAARIISTVSSDAKAAIARRAGADHTVNYRTEDTAARILELTAGTGVDLIVEVDFAANFPVIRRVIRRGGSIAVYAAGAGAPPPLDFPVSNVNVRHILVYDMAEDAKTAAVADTTRWLTAGQLTGMDGPHFPLSETAAAHEAVRNGAVGKVIIDVAALFAISADSAMHGDAPQAR